MRVLFHAGMWMAVFVGISGWGSPAARADKPVEPAPMPLCATDTIDHLPTGTTFKASSALIAKVKERELKEQGRAKDAESRFESSPYERQFFPLIYVKKVEWADGSAIGVTCNIETTPLALTTGRFTIMDPKDMKRVVDTKDPDPKPIKVETIHSKIFKPDGTEFTPFRRYTIMLDSSESAIPAKLVCEVEVTKIDKNHPESPFEKTLLPIGQLEDLLFEEFPIQMVTNNSKCAAIQGNQVLQQTQGMNAPAAGERPSTGIRHNKDNLPSGDPGGPPASAPAAASARH